MAPPKSGPTVPKWGVLLAPLAIGDSVTIPSQRRKSYINHVAKKLGMKVKLRSNEETTIVERIE